MLSCLSVCFSHWTRVITVGRPIGFSQLTVQVFILYRLQKHPYIILKQKTWSTDVGIGNYHSPLFPTLCRILNAPLLQIFYTTPKFCMCPPVYPYVRFYTQLLFVLFLLALVIPKSRRHALALRRCSISVHWMHELFH